MVARTAVEIEGFEFDWLGADSEGRVALFTTAGRGYAPPSFLADTDRHDAAIEALLRLAASTRALRAPQLRSDLPNTWRSVAERGVFAYDATGPDGSYKLVAVPESPLHVDQLPAAVRMVVAETLLRETRLGTVDVISGAELRVTCERR